MDQSPSSRRAWLAGLVAALLALAACGPRQPVVTEPPEDPEGDPRLPAIWNDPGTCDPLAGRAGPGGDFVVVLGEPVDPAHAPLARNHAERIVFANLYETLINVSCDGRPSAGLAERWEPLDGGRRWRLLLREDAVLWDGTSVDAAVVLASWRRSAALAAVAGRPFAGRWVEPAAPADQPADPRSLIVELAEPRRDLPLALAHPDLAVAGDRQGWLWPLGSGPCRLSAETDLPLPDLVCRPHLHHPRPPIWNSLTFRVLADRDPRDLLATGGDLAVFRDRQAAAYHAQLPDVRTAALPWDRIYALLLPPSSQVAAALAAREVRETVTPAESREWSSLAFHECRRASCSALSSLAGVSDAPADDLDPAPDAAQRARLVHAAGDADARALVERTAAFLPTAFTPHAPDPAALARSLEQGRAAGYVVRLEAAQADPCLALAELLAAAPWLPHDAAGGDDGCVAAERLVREGRAVPLVATAPRLAWRGALAGLRLAHDGAPLFARLGRPEPPGELP